MAHNHAFGLHAYEKILRACLLGNFVQAVTFLEWFSVGHGISNALSALIAKEKFNNKEFEEHLITQAVTEIAPGVHAYWLISMLKKVLESAKKDDTQTVQPNNIMLGGVGPNHQLMHCVDCYEAVIGLLMRSGMLSEDLRKMISDAGGQTDIILLSDDSALSQQIISLIEIIKIVPIQKDQLEIPHSEINAVGSYFSVLQQIENLVTQGREDEAKKLCRYAICKYRFEKCKSEIEKALIYQEEILLSETSVFSSVENQKQRYKNVLDKKMHEREAVEMIRTLFKPIDMGTALRAQS